MKSQTTDVVSPEPIAPLPARPKRWRIVLLGIAILMLGALIGSGVTVIVIKKMVLHAISHPEKASARIANRIQRKLDLSAEQAAQVRSIIAERQKALQAIRREVQPRVEKELNGLRDDVAALLEPDKARRWRERFDRLKRSWVPAPLPAGGS